MKKLLLSLGVIYIGNSVFADDIRTISNDIKQVGNAKIKSSNDDDSTLYINNKPINLEIPSKYLDFRNIATIKDKKIYYIHGATGGTIDSDLVTCQFITLSANKKVSTSKIVDCGDLSLKDGNIIAKLQNNAPYAEPSDISSYSYNTTTNQITTISKANPDSYYKQKFSTYTAKQIYQIAQSDGCIDNSDGSLNTAHVCGWGAKYCFIFKSMKKPQKDSYYKKLNTACKNN